LPDQDRRSWDRLLIRRGLAALAEAERLAADASSRAAPEATNRVLGPYALQAAIAACHARATTAEETDWARIAALYRVLGTVSPSPVVELNRAVAVGRAEGPAAGLAVVEAVRSERSLAGYALLPAVRADLLASLGRVDEARAEFEAAARLTRNERERSIFLARAAQLEVTQG
jgi:predicted RNA polymerase sigma factor